MMNKDELSIIDFVSKYTPISSEMERVILEHSNIKTIKKGTLLLKEGDIAEECFFILKGCLKKYHLIDQEEKITGFYTEGQVVTPGSYTNRAPSKYFISAMEDTIASFGNPDTEKDAYEKHPELETITRVLVEKLMATMNDDFDDWVSHNPEERYLILLDKRPDLLQRIPQYQIANFLGIKPESLSRIRKRLSK